MISNTSEGRALTLCCLKAVSGSSRSNHSAQTITRYSQRTNQIQRLSLFFCIGWKGSENRFWRAYSQFQLHMEMRINTMTKFEANTFAGGPCLNACGKQLCFQSLYIIHIYSAQFWDHAQPHKQSNPEIQTSLGVNSAGSRKQLEDFQVLRRAGIPR